MPTPQELSNFIWQIADLLRGPYRPPQYERVMLPMTVLRRFDCALEATKPQVLERYEQLQRDGKFEGDALDSILNRTAGERFHNHSPLNFEKLKGDHDNVDKHLVSYINGFSANVRRIFDYFEFATEIEKMREADILYAVVSTFCDVDLHPNAVGTIEMGLVFEDLIRRFNEQANETAGDHFTPREVIRLMVNLLFLEDDDLLATRGTVRKMLDPTCGTGGMLAEAQKYLREHHQQATLYVYGQDFNPRAYAMAASDLLIKGHEASRIEFGNSLTEDKFPDERFDYFCANPPFGVDWKREQKEIQREHEKQGYAGRFGAGLPRVNDGSLLFLQHMIAKFERFDVSAKQFGSRLAIVFNGSPLFTGGAGSGESNIRKWVIENDWLEAIVALPEQMFYNTGIGTYVWVLTNRKSAARKGKIQLVDARDRWKPMRRSLGDKRRYLADEDIAAITREYGERAEGETSRLFDNADFGYTRVTVERPLRLVFQIDLDRIDRFLYRYPLLADDVEAIDEALGRVPYLDWNGVRAACDELLRRRGRSWKTAEWRVFRDIFTRKSADALPVIAAREPLKSGKLPTDAERFTGWFLPEVASELPEEVRPSAFFTVLSAQPDLENCRVRYEADADLRDYENIPLKEDAKDYFRREVLPHVPDAWMDRDKDKVGYEINFNRHFYRYTLPRPLAAIDTDLKAAEDEILRLLREVTE